MRDRKQTMGKDILNEIIKDYQKHKLKKLNLKIDELFEKHIK